MLQQLPEVPSTVPTPGQGGGVLVVTAMPVELRPLVRRTRGRLHARVAGTRVFRAGAHGTTLLMASTGVGLARAERTAGDLLDALQVGALVGMGVCGGLSPDLAAGAVVVGEEVWGPSGKASPDPAWLRRARNTRVEPGILMSVPAIASSRETKSRLLAELPPGAVAGVDMESAAWARAAEARGVPHLVLRIVLDPAGEELPKVLESCQDGEGGLRRGYVAREALLHPEIIPALVSLDRRMRSSAGSLAEALLAVLAETPSPGER